jgi:hypothetical protein
MKAETQLVNLERRTIESVENCRAAWAEKRAAFVRALPADVLGMLIAGRVLDEAEVHGIEPLHD